MCSIFNTSRVFSERDVGNGLTEWFFMAREGIMGPYESKEYANRELQNFIARCIALNSTGGRHCGQELALSLEQGFRQTLRLQPGRRVEGLS